MKRPLIAILVALVAPPCLAGDLVQLDLRRSVQDEGGWLWFCADGRSFALAAASGSREEIETAFGMSTIGGGGAQLGAVDALEVLSLRDNGAALVVRIDTEAWGRASEQIEEWNRRTYVLAASHELLNLTERLLGPLDGLKKPYRSALSGPDPAGYFSDLFALNPAP